MSRALVLVVFLLAASGAWADDVMDVVQAAIASEHAASSEQAKIFVERAGVADLYLIDRVGTSRLHLIRNPERGPQEVIIVDGLVWLRSPEGWRKSPLRTAPSGVPSIAGLLKSGLTDLSEQQPINDYRVFVGNIAWGAGRQNTGRFELRLDASGMPRIIHFDGTCAGASCRFHEKIDYNAQITVVPPN
jgi:hypothetical protein